MQHARNPVGFLHGINCLLQGYRLIAKPGLRPFVLVPLVVNTLLFAAAFWWLGSWLDSALARWLPDWLDWLEWLLWPVFALTILAVAWFVFTLVANLIAGPFNGVLSRRVAMRLDATLPDTEPGEAGSVWMAIPSAVAGEVRKWVYFLGWFVLLLVLTFIPVVNLLAPALWFLFAAWCLALEFADFPLGNRDLDFPAQRRLVRSHAPAALGFGAAALGAALIPVVNFALMPAAVAGATVLWEPLARPATP